MALGSISSPPSHPPSKNGLRSMNKFCYSNSTGSPFFCFEIMQNVILCIWFLQLNFIFVRFIHIVTHTVIVISQWYMAPMVWIHVKFIYPLSTLTSCTQEILKMRQMFVQQLECCLGHPHSLPECLIPFQFHL